MGLEDIQERVDEILNEEGFNYGFSDTVNRSNFNLWCECCGQDESLNKTPVDVGYKAIDDWRRRNFVVDS